MLSRFAMTIRRFASPRRPFATAVAVIAAVGVLAGAAHAQLAVELGRQRLLGTGTVMGDRFGSCVAMSGDHAMVVASRIMGVGVRVGTLFFYERDETGTWIQTDVLTESDLGVSGIYAFNEECDLDGSTAVFTTEVGDPIVSDVHVLERIGGVWSTMATTLSTPNGVVHQVRLSGDDLLVGAHDDQLQGGYVFTRTGSTWGAPVTLTGVSGGGVVLERVGESVAIQGDTAVLGAPFSNSVNGSDSGAVVVFTRAGGVWTQQTILIADTVDVLDQRFGEAVALDGDLLAIGQPVRPGPDNAGSVYVFRGAGASWIEEDRLVAEDPQVGAFLGESVDVSGEWIAAAAPRYDASPLVNNGAVYVFGGIGGQWRQAARLISDPAENNEQTGTSLDLEGQDLLVGTIEEFVSANGPGYAEVIRLQLGPSVPIAGWLGMAMLLGAASMLGARLNPRRSLAAWRGR